MTTVTKQHEKEEQRLMEQTAWTWDEILDGKGSWTWEEILAGEDRLPWRQVEIAREERRRYEELANSSC
jgi:hypothetical protein